jgi:hypothetical protein
MVFFIAVFFMPLQSEAGKTLKHPQWSEVIKCDIGACPRFELIFNGEGVLDHETGLIWEKSPSTTTTS